MPSAFPSAILYLNGDFDGGDFYFTELDAKTVTVSTFAPVPGRQALMVQRAGWPLVFVVATRAPLPTPRSSEMYHLLV